MGVTVSLRRHISVDRVNNLSLGLPIYPSLSRSVTSVCISFFLSLSLSCSLYHYNIYYIVMLIERDILKRYFVKAILVEFGQLMKLAGY